MVSDIPNIIKDLSDDLRRRVDLVVTLTEELMDLQAQLDVAKRDLRRVKIALESLSGNDIPVPERGSTATGVAPAEAETPSPVYSPSDPERPAQTVEVPPADPRPICNSCQSGRMNYTRRTLNNGKVVNLWLCGECRNERF
jgi:hypothetical protein